MDNIFKNGLSKSTVKSCLNILHKHKFLSLFSTLSFVALVVGLTINLTANNGAQNSSKVTLSYGDRSSQALNVPSQRAGAKTTGTGKPSTKPVQQPGSVTPVTNKGSSVASKSSSATGSSKNSSTNSSPTTNNISSSGSATTNPTNSGMSTPAGYSSSDLIFQDNFSGSSLDATKWNPYISSKGSGGYPWNASSADAATGSGVNAGGYEGEWYMPGQVSVNNGLSLTSVNTQTKAGYPWTSGIVSTYGKFEMLGGYLQVRMKQPSGDGMWPAIWMLPGSGASTTTDNYEIDLQEGGFLDASANPADVMAMHEENPGTTCGATNDTGQNLSAGYHTYGLKWVPGSSITYYFDGNQVGQFTNASCNIANEPLELLISAGVSNNSASGFRTITDGTTPASSTMSISQVQAYQ